MEGVRGRPPFSEVEKAGHAALKKRLGDALGRPMPIPYGQWGSADDLTEPQIGYVSRYWKSLEQASKWPVELLGFEAWCGMTCYDASLADGGPAFQRLMMLLLGNGSAPTLGGWTGLNSQLDIETTWDAEKREYGPMFKVEQYKFGQTPPSAWYEGMQGDGAPLGLEPDPKLKLGNAWMSSGAHLSIHSRPSVRWWAPDYKPTGNVKDIRGQSQKVGLIIGNASSNKDMKAIQGEGSKHTTDSNHYTPYSKHDWLVKSLLQTGTRGGTGQSQTIGQGLVSSGVDKVGDVKDGGASTCWEATSQDQPCMLLQNSMAAIYGLYYYPGCRHKDLNWEVHEEVPDDGLNKTFRIRFRCPNPRYGHGNNEWLPDEHGKGGGEALDSLGRLFVYEPLNPQNTTFLDKYLDAVVDRYNGRASTQNIKKYPKHTTVGGVYGIETANRKDERSTQLNRFEVPRASRKKTEAHPTISPWTNLMDKDDLMLIAPFWNHTETWHELKSNAHQHFGRSLTLRNSGIVVAGEVKDEMGFGFRMSQAFVLYPHHKTPNAILKRTNLQAQVATPVGYMTEPVRATSMPTAGVDPPLAAHVLDWNSWKDLTPDQWRARLLGKTHTPKGKGKATVAASPALTVSAAPSGDAAAVEGGVVADLQTVTVDADLATGESETLELEDSELPEPGQTATNTDLAQAASTAVNGLYERNTVATTFGIPGMSVAETLKAYDPSYEFTDVDVRKLAAKDTGDDSKLNPEEKSLKAALKACGLLNPALEEGAARRNNEEQCHWRTARHSPWSHEECYNPARLIMKYTRVDEEDIAKRQARYGPGVNLTQDESDNIKTIDGIELQWGSQRGVFENYLDHDDPVSRLNFARILVMYFSPNGVGHFTFAQKQAGMLRGLQCCKGSAYNPQEVEPVGGGRAKKSFTPLWGKVFEEDPEKVLDPELLFCLKEGYMCNREVTNDDELLKCLEHGAPSYLGSSSGWMQKLSKLKSKMTVGQWVTTPWHLEHLPYQRQYAVFRDGECFSEGCKRCSRRFYEYAYHVYADRQSVPGTFGYPQDLWAQDDERCAPVPLHDPQFWVDPVGGKHLWENAESGHPKGYSEGGVTREMSTKQKKRAATKRALRQATPYEEDTAMVERGDAVHREYGFYTGGTMDWPMYRLHLDKINRGDRNRKLIAAGRDMFFRRYINMAYSVVQAGDTLEDRNQTYYRAICQGYMLRGNSKVKFGQMGFRVTRSHKYGNVCRDCASLLDRAPGLFIRNNRWEFEGGLVKGNQEAVTAATNDYWQHVFGEMVNADGEKDEALSKLSMDAFLMKGLRGEERTSKLSRLPPEKQRQYVEAFDVAAAKLKETMNARFVLPKGFTRLIEQPTIHVQKSVAGADRTPEQIAEAVQTLRALFNGEDPSQIAGLSNPALKDVVKEAERKYIHNEAYASIDATKQFDSDVLRTEHRNCVIRWSDTRGLEWLNHPGHTNKFTYNGVEQGREGWILPLNGKKFGKLTESRYARNKAPPGAGRVSYNCLITDQYDPDLLDMRKIRDSRLPTPQEAYRMEVYVSTRFGARGQVKYPSISAKTQWKGDGFICDPDDIAWRPSEQDDGRALTQQRLLRQSRLFITYSLHRSISDPREGRLILERMADALYTLFGNDRWLSELIVFGKMLKRMDVSKQAGDNVSKAMWGVIDRTKKQDAMTGFYGSRDKNKPRTSYVYDTYETHIDKVDIDGGCEIGPKMGHPHFHMLLTLNHFSYVQFDYFKMNTFLEIMFKGVDTAHGWKDSYKLPNNFYGDNENPYVDIRLYPQDNWKEILAAYVRKSAIPSIIEVEAARRLPGTAQQRRGMHNGTAPPPPEDEDGEAAAERAQRARDEEEEERGPVVGDP